MFVDNKTTAQWRADEFYPVLNERDQNADSNLHAAGVMSQLLALKNQHPLPEGAILPDSFDFSLTRDQQCPSSSELADFSRNYPTWRMPDGLPKLEHSEYKTLQRWLEQGAKMAPLPELRAEYNEQVFLWEQFLNGDSLKQQLVARYIYEHWFLAHLYFSGLPKGEHLRLVRSRTPPGQTIDIIATRRPYDDRSC